MTLAKAQKVLGGPWAAVVAETLRRADHPSQWSIHETKKGRFALDLGGGLPALVFLNMTAASITQGMLTVAKLSLSESYAN